MNLDLGSGVQIVEAPYGHGILVDGCRIPHCMVMLQGSPGDHQLVLNGNLSILVDNRMAFDVPVESAAAWLRLLANAMAVAAGMTCFGPHARMMAEGLYGCVYNPPSASGVT